MVMKVLNITELARIERSSGKIYPAGCTLIQISATRGQVLYQAEEKEVPDRYAVLIPNDKVLAKYLFHAVSHQSPKFFHAVQTGLNIQIEALSEMKVRIHIDLEKQAEIVSRLDMNEKLISAETATIESLEKTKKTLLSQLFVSK